MRVVLDILKSSIFVVQKLALLQNEVEFCQQSFGDIRFSLAISYNVMQRRATESKFLSTHPLTHILTKSCIEAGTLPKNN